MGDKPQNSQQTMQTSNQTSTTGPNPTIAPMLNTLVGGAWDYMQPNWQAPGYFPGGTVAPQSDRTGIANTAQWQLATNNLSSPMRGAGQQQIIDTLTGKFLDPNLNTAYQGWLDASFRPQTEQLMNQILPGIDSKFSGSGRTAGGAHFDTTMRGVNDLNRSQADAAAKSALGMYQGERDKQFQAMSFLPQFQNMDYQDIAAMQRSGGMVDAYGQRLLDDRNAKHTYDSTAQLDWFARLAQTLQGMMPGGQTTGTSQSTATGMGGGGGGGGFGSVAGGIMSGLGTVAQFLPMFGISDAKATPIGGLF